MKGVEQGQIPIEKRPRVGRGKLLELGSVKLRGSERPKRSTDARDSASAGKTHLQRTRLCVDLRRFYRLPLTSTLRGDSVNQRRKHQRLDWNRPGTISPLAGGASFTCLIKDL